MTPSRAGCVGLGYGVGLYALCAHALHGSTSVGRIHHLTLAVFDDVIVSFVAVFGVAVVCFTVEVVVLVDVVIVAVVGILSYSLDQYSSR